MILKFTNARANYLIALACVVLIAASTYLFLYQKNDPGYWDEAWHIPTAQKYIDKIFALENHPPVGKLLIAAGEKLVGKNSGLDLSSFWHHDHTPSWPIKLEYMGFRLFPSLLAFFSAILIFHIFLLLTKRPWIAVFCSLLYCLENALIVQSRGAMLEGIQIFFVVGAVFVALRIYLLDRQSHWHYALIGLLWGLAVFTKVNALIFAVVLLLPFGSIIYAHRKSLAKIITACLTRSAVMMSVILAVGFGSFWIHFGLGQHVVEGRDYGASEKLLSRLKDEKSWSPITTIVGIQEWFAFTKDVNRRAIHDPDNVGSPAYGWPFGYGSIILGTRPHYAGKGVLNTYGPQAKDDPTAHIGPEVYIHLTDQQQSYYTLVARIRALIGNPVVWVMVTLAVILSIGLLIAKPFVREKLPHNRHFWTLVVLMITYLLYIIGVSLVSRTVYLHHYLLPYTLGIVLFGALLAYILPLIENRCIKALQFLCIIATMSMFGAHIWYAPFTYNLPLTPEQYRVRDVFLWWHLDDAFEGLELPTSPMHTTSNGTSGK